MTEVCALVENETEPRRGLLGDIWVAAARSV